MYAGVPAADAMAASGTPSHTSSPLEMKNDDTETGLMTIDYTT